MTEEVDYPKEKPKNVNRNRAILGGCILLVLLAGLGSFRVFRPVIVMDTDKAGIYVRNRGDMDALIYRVDGLWYWAGQVALLANIPSIRQRVRPAATSVRLQIPDIPIRSEQAIQKNACYMKLLVRYRIPGIPIFRYTTPLYFKCHPNRKTWDAVKHIPAKHRSLGNLAVGNVGKIELDFH
jgi:hypothetical protein